MLHVPTNEVNLIYLIGPHNTKHAWYARVIVYAVYTLLVHDSVVFISVVSRLLTVTMCIHTKSDQS
jgi:hypothetical protein